MNHDNSIITLWHGTAKENILNIIGSKEGLKRGNDGMIYFCETADNCLGYIYMYHGNDETPGEYAVIPVKVTQEEFNTMIKNYDNNPKYTPDAYAYDKDIPADRLPDIRHLEDVLLYVIGGTQEQRDAIINADDEDEFDGGDVE